MIELIRNAGAVAEESYWLFDAAVAGRVRDFFMTADTSAAVNAYRLEHSLQEMAQTALRSLDAVVHRQTDMAANVAAQDAVADMGVPAPTLDAEIAEDNRLTVKAASHRIAQILEQDAIMSMRWVRQQMLSIRTAGSRDPQAMRQEAVRRLADGGLRHRAMDRAGRMYGSSASVRTTVRMAMLDVYLDTYCGVCVGRDVEEFDVIRDDKAQQTFNISELGVIRKETFHPNTNCEIKAHSPMSGI